MFETNFRNSLPGYTGHIPSKIDEDYQGGNAAPRRHIPGKYIYLKSDL
jgi:hypothetical protein